VTLRLVLDYKISTLASGELGGAGLFGIEMVESRLPRKNLAVLGKFQSLAV
jgi:hypothetical protein